jgi:hypothetical protein
LPSIIEDVELVAPAGAADDGPGVHLVNVIEDDEAASGTRAERPEVGMVPVLSSGVTTRSLIAIAISPRASIRLIGRALSFKA